jgi:hypothetical protein
MLLLNVGAYVRCLGAKLAPCPLLKKLPASQGEFSGEFSPLGQLFSLVSFINFTEVAPNFMPLC